MLRQPENGPRGVRVRRLLAACGILGLFAAAPARAQEPAPSKATCAEAYESSQETRASGALQETRTRLAFCAQTQCPAFVQKDCARWLEEVDRELPSVVVSIVGLDAEQSRDVSIKIDGKPVASEALSGKSISLDPGKHELVLERPGAEPVVRIILAQQGVQNRNVELHVTETAAPAAAAALNPEADVAASSASPLRSIAYASWGVGVLGLGAFAVLGTMARADKKGFEEDCAFVTSISDNERPGVCLDTTLDERRAKYEREEVLADVGLVTGIVGAATGAVLFVLSMEEGDAATADPDATATAGLKLDVAPARGGAWVSLSGAF